MRRYVLLFLIVLAVPARADGPSLYFIDTGPLRLRDTFILNTGFLVMEPDTPTPVSGGRWRVDAFHTKSNTFAKSAVVDDMLDERTARAPVTRDQLRSLNPGGGLLYLDGELDITKLSLDYQLDEHWQFGVLLQRIDFRGGGGLDDTIENFHSNFGFGQAGRLGVHRGQFSAYLRGPDGEFYVDQAPSARLGDVVLNAKYSEAVDGQWDGWVWGVKTALKLPVRDAGLLSSGEPDAGVQLMVARNYEHSCIHLDVSATYLGEHPAYGVDSQTVVSATAAYEVGLSDKSSVVGQLTASQSPLRSLDIPELAETSTQVSLGYKRQVAQRTALFAAFTENIAHFDNTADVGFHLGVSHNF